MTIDMKSFRPPTDPCFDELLEYAVTGGVPVYGVVLEADKVRVRRFDETFRPEDSSEGKEVLASLMTEWSGGRPVQPWLYVDGDTYVSADDYFFMALLEVGRPSTFAAQILGKPLPEGLMQQVGPLPVAQVRVMLGIRQ